MHRESHRRRLARARLAGDPENGAEAAASILQPLLKRNAATEKPVKADLLRPGNLAYPYTGIGVVETI